MAHIQFTKNMRYLYNEARDTLWFSHLIFCMAILISHTRLDWSSIRGSCYSFQARFRVLFPRYEISSFEQWNPSEHIPRYLDDAELSDSLQVRQDFLHLYHASTLHTAAYLRALPEEMRTVYQRWVFPPMPVDLYQAYSRRGLVQEEQRMSNVNYLGPRIASRKNLTLREEDASWEILL